jgi:hypothetical protein
MSLKSLKINVEAAVSGLWVDFPEPNSDGTLPGFLLSRPSKANPAYTKAINAVRRKHKRAIALETLPDAVADKETLVSFVNTCLHDWRNLQPEDDGNNVAFSAEAAIDLLGNPEWEALYDWVATEASRIGNERAAALEDEGKN